MSEILLWILYISKWYISDQLLKVNIIWLGIREVYIILPYHQIRVNII